MIYDDNVIYDDDVNDDNDDDDNDDNDDNETLCSHFY